MVSYVVTLEVPGEGIDTYTFGSDAYGWATAANKVMELLYRNAAVLQVSYAHACLAFWRSGKLHSKPFVYEFLAKDKTVLVRVSMTFAPAYQPGLSNFI